MRHSLRLPVASRVRAASVSSPAVDSSSGFNHLSRRRAGRGCTRALLRALAHPAVPLAGPVRVRAAAGRLDALRDRQTQFRLGPLAFGVTVRQTPPGSECRCRFAAIVCSAAQGDLDKQHGQSTDLLGTDRTPRSERTERDRRRRNPSALPNTCPSSYLRHVGWQSDKLSGGRHQPGTRSTPPIPNTAQIAILIVQVRRTSLPP